MNQTFVCCSTYHGYVAILEAYRYKKMGYDSILIFLEDSMNGIDEFVDNMRKVGIFKEVISIKGYSLMRKLKKDYSLFQYVTQRSSIVVDSYEKANPQLLTASDFIKNSQINLFQITRSKAYFLIKYPDNFFRMYEDGLGTYDQKLPFVRYINRKYILRFPLLKGHDQQVKEVYVKFPEKVVDKILIPKLKHLDISKLEEALEESQKFNVLSALIGGVAIQNYNTSLIVTQPLSEDRICSEAIKVKLYKQIVVDQLAEGRIVYLKTHPRETTKYDFGEQVFQLPKFFPLEVFNLSGKLRIERAITYFSTVLYNLKHVEEKVILGEDFLKKEIIRLEKE